MTKKLTGKDKMVLAGIACIVALAVVFSVFMAVEHPILSILAFFIF